MQQQSIKVGLPKELREKLEKDAAPLSLASLIRSRLEQHYSDRAEYDVNTRFLGQA
jgi:hypothetical protein